MQDYLSLRIRSFFLQSPHLIIILLSCYRYHFVGSWWESNNLRYQVDRVIFFWCQAEAAERSEAQTTICELYARAWKLTEPVMNILARCLPLMTHLHTLNLWYVGLTNNTLNVLASAIYRCQALKNLYLDGNPVSEEHWDLLIIEVVVFIVSSFFTRSSLYIIEIGVLINSLLELICR